MRPTGHGVHALLSGTPLYVFAGHLEHPALFAPNHPARQMQAISVLLPAGAMEWGVQYWHTLDDVAPVTVEY